MFFLLGGSPLDWAEWTANLLKIAGTVLTMAVITYRGKMCFIQYCKLSPGEQYRHHMSEGGYRP